MINFDELTNYGFNSIQINAIKNGIENSNLEEKIIKQYFCDTDNKDPKILENQLKYNEMQINEIMQGLIEGIDASYYADSTIPADSMRQIRKKLNFDKGMECEANIHYKNKNSKANNNKILSNLDFIKNFNLVSLSFAFGVFAIIIAFLCVVILIINLK